MILETANLLILILILCIAGVYLFPIEVVLSSIFKFKTSKTFLTILFLGITFLLLARELKYVFIFNAFIVFLFIWGLLLLTWIPRKLFYILVIGLFTSMPVLYLLNLKILAGSVATTTFFVLAILAFRELVYDKS